jgi:SSS family solute:Na+ symporter
VQPIDWIIVLAVLAVLTVAAIRTRRHAGSVAGFLAAERCGGRYLITVANNAAMVGVISLVWFFEQNFDVGFTTMWWQLMEGPALIVMALSGWVYYRYRQTRALTLAQFFDARYGRSFRVFAGLVAFTAGIINFGIFPATGARFFIAMWDLPAALMLGPLAIPMFPLLMAALLAISLLFVLAGGQIAVMVTDFLQGSLGQLVFVAVIGWLMWSIGWDRIAHVLSQPATEQLVHPFRLQDESRFDVWYYMIGVLILFYTPLGWQGTAGYYTCAIDAHEAKMANILNGWRPRVLLLITLAVPLAVRTLLEHPDFGGPDGAGTAVAAQLATIDAEQLRVQLRVPTALPALLPPVLLGLMSAALLGAFISTHDTYLHSWGSMFVQDVVLPFRREPLSPAAHLRALRWGIVGVAIFIFFFSLLYQPTQYIAMFLALTGSIFVGGAGAAIIGGLYWRRGSPAAAWTAMIIGMGFSTTSVVLKQLPPIDVTVAAWGPLPSPAALARWIQDELTGQELTFVSILCSVSGYVLVSLLGRRHEHDMDRLLHRGAYATVEPADLAVTGGTGGTGGADGAEAAEAARPEAPRRTWLTRIGITDEFTRRDVVATLVTVAWPAAWTVVFIVGTVYNLTTDVPRESWLGFWHGWLWLTYGAGVVVTIWFTIGGVRDLIDLRRRLRAIRPDERDDGRVAPEDSP